jgi:TctA family transporter
LRQSLIISDAGVGILFMRPISAVLVTAALLAVLVPVARWAWRLRRRAADAAPSGPARG